MKERYNHLLLKITERKSNVDYDSENISQKSSSESLSITPRRLRQVTDPGGALSGASSEDRTNSLYSLYFLQISYTHEDI